MRRMQMYSLTLVLLTTGLAGAQGIRFGVSSARDSLQYVEALDDFLGPQGTTNFTIGDLGWNIPAGTIAVTFSLEHHQGIRQLSSTNSSNTVGHITLRTVHLPQVSYIAGIVKPVSGTTTISARFGVSGGLSTSGEGANGMYFSFLPGTSPNWRVRLKDGSGMDQIIQTTVEYAVGTWYLLEMIRIGTAFQFKIKGVVVGTHEAPSLNNPGPLFAIETNENVAKTMDIDYFRLVTTITANRF